MPVLELSALELRAACGRLLFQTQGCRFPSAEFTVIAGQSGSGKSLLARLLGGVVSPDSGTVSLDGAPLRHPRDFARAGVVLAAQDPGSQLIGRSARDELGFGLPASAGIDGWLDWAGLAGMAGTDPRDLSCGEQRRLGLATALARDPRVLVLDDPFSGLDQAFVPVLLRQLLDRHQAGRGVILVTNELEKVLAHAERLVLLKQGRIIADALPERVLPYLDAHGFRKSSQKLAEMSWLKA